MFGKGYTLLLPGTSRSRATRLRRRRARSVSQRILARLRPRNPYSLCYLMLIVVALTAFLRINDAAVSSLANRNYFASCLRSWDVCRLSSARPVASSENELASASVANALISRFPQLMISKLLCIGHEPGAAALFGLIHCPPSPATSISDAARIRALANKTVLTIKTGTSQLWDTVPVHIAVPRPDIPNRIFFSDAEVHFGDVHVIDVLANVSQTIQEDDKFKAYHDIHQSLNERIPMEKGFSHWELDKFKTLPLIGAAHRMYPNADWIVLLDGDTFIFWTSLLRWLSTFDAGEPHMFGRLHTDGQRKWAHGGAGYVLSRGVIEATYAIDPWNFERGWDTASIELRGGDVIISHVLAKTKALREEGPDGGNSLFTSEPVRDVVFNEDVWLSPILTLHHLTPAEIYELQQFEAMRLPQLGQTDYIRYCDLFKHFAPSFLTAAVRSYATGANAETSLVRHGWHAGEGNAVVYPKSFADVRNVPYDADLCEALCTEEPKCFSWTFEDNAQSFNRRCVISKGAWGFGKPDKRFHSGWRIDRITQFEQKHDCGDAKMRKATDYQKLRADDEAGQVMAEKVSLALSNDEMGFAGQEQEQEQEQEMKSRSRDEQHFSII